MVNSSKRICTQMLPTQRSHLNLFVVGVFCCFLLVFPSSLPFNFGAHSVFAEEAPPKEANGYIIGPGDIVEILVWKEPDISRTVHVRPDGRISLPLVDDVRAAGNTTVQLKTAITKALGSFIDNPAVYVMLQENRSKKVYVVGAVAAPGEYLLEKPTTVLQAIAMAGGFGEWAKKDDIVILRKDLGKDPEGQSRIEFDYERVVSGKDVAQNIRLRADDVIIVP